MEYFIDTNFTVDPVTGYNESILMARHLTTVFMIIVISALLICVSIFKFFGEMHPGLALFSMTMSKASSPLINIITVRKRAIWDAHVLA